MIVTLILLTIRISSYYDYMSVIYYLMTFWITTILIPYAPSRSLVDSHYQSLSLILLCG